MRLRVLLIATLVTLSAACAPVTNIRRSNSEVDANRSEADAALAALRSGKATVDDPVQVVKDRPYTPSEPIVLNRQRTLPAHCYITFAPADAVTVLEFGQAVTKTCGLQVRVTPDALQATQNGAMGGAVPAAAAPNAAAGIPLPAGVQLPAGVSPGGIPAPYAVAPNLVNFRYAGDLVQLLDAATARLGLSWRYSNNIITIFYLDTRFFHVFKIPTGARLQSQVTSGTTSSSGISGGSGGGGGGSGSSGNGGGGSGGVSGSATSAQTTNIELDLDPAQDLQRTIESMLTPNVGRMAFSKFSGEVTVTDTPEVLDRIGAYLDNFNDFATKQVLLNIQVLTVNVDDSDELGINWNLIYKNIADQYGIGLVNSFATADDAISGSVNILQGNSRFSGSQLIVNALSKQGRISSRTQQGVTALNMQAVPVQVGTQEGFVQRTSTTLTADVGATTSREQGTITTGSNFTVLPYILPDGRTVLLQLSMNMAELIGQRSVGDGNEVIEMPKVANRISSPQVRLRTGETLVLSGFERSTTTADRAGTGSAWNFLFGGGLRSSKQREMIVVMVTPVILD